MKLDMETRTVQLADAVVIVVKSKLLYGGVSYTAWERSNVMGPHSTLMHIDGVCYGQIGTRRLAGIEHLRGGSPERLAALAVHRQREADRALDAILSGYPEAAEGRPAIGMPYELETA